MKRSTKPPTAPAPDGPSSGRARKDVNYMPAAAPVPPQPRSVSPVRAPPGLPSTRAAAADEYEMMEDLATPMRQAAPALLVDPTTGPAAPGSVRDLAARAGPSSTGPLPALPPPSSRGATFGPSSQQAMQAMQQASSGRMRQVTPMDAPPLSSYPSSQVPINQITGPQMPVIQRPASAWSDSGQSSVPSSARRSSADDGVPLGYVVASAFFLAIALVGFGLYLAFEVF